MNSENPKPKPAPTKVKKKKPALVAQSNTPFWVQLNNSRKRPKRK